MNCQTSRRLMHLDRSGERTEREAADLLEHLSSCADCAAEAQKVATVRSLESLVRESELPIPDLSEVRARVLAATTRPLPRRSFVPMIPRLAYALAIAGIAGWFGLEQWQIRSDHAALLRSDREFAVTVGPQIVYSVDAGSLDRLSMPGRTLPAEILADGKIEVAQSTALDWIDHAPSFLARTFSSRPAQQAQLAEALKALQSVVEVSIRYRTTGA